MLTDVIKNIEKISVPEKLRNTKKPVVLYGMGGGAEKIIDYFGVNGIEIRDIFASDEFVRGHSFRGRKVKKLSEIQAAYADFVIIVAFATRDGAVIEKICELSRQYELYVPDIPVFGDIFFDYEYFMKNADSLEKVYSLLADEKSREIFANAVNFKISGKLEYLINSTTPKTEALSLFGFDEYKDKNKRLVYVDLGAYDGDTVFELAKYFKSTGSAGSIENSEIFDKIIAFEPDKKNFRKLLNNLDNSENWKNLKETDCFLYNALHEKCRLYNIGAFDKKTVMRFNQKAGRNSYLPDTGDIICNTDTDGKFIVEINVDTVDNIIDGIGADIAHDSDFLIKYDVEGAEYEALKGAEKTIKKYRTGICTALYHRSDDLLRLPLLVNEMNPGYKFYLRKHEYIPFWDFNLYAVPL